MGSRILLARYLEQAEELLETSTAVRLLPRRILAGSFLFLALVVSTIVALITWPVRAARRRTTSRSRTQIPVVDAIESEHLEEPALIVDVSADWCGPCLILDEVIQQFSIRHDNVCIVKINASVSSREATRLSVVGLPTLIFFSFGNEVGRHAGTLSVENLEKLASDCFGR